MCLGVKSGHCIIRILLQMENKTTDTHWAKFCLIHFIKLFDQSELISWWSENSCTLSHFLAFHFISCKIKPPVTSSTWNLSVFAPPSLCCLKAPECWPGSLSVSNYVEKAACKSDVCINVISHCCHPFWFQGERPSDVYQHLFNAFNLMV